MRPGSSPGVVARVEGFYFPGECVMVLGVVVVVGVVVDGAGAVVEGVGLPAPSARGIGSGEDCGAGAGPFPISETSALDGGGEAGAFAVDGAAAAGAPVGALGLPLAHLGAALDILLTGLLVELVPGSSAGAPVRPYAAATPGRDVLGRRPAGLLRLPVACPLLVDGSGCDLLGLVLGAAPL